MTQDDRDARLVLQALWAGQDPYGLAVKLGGGRGRIDYLLNHLAASGLYDRHAKRITARGESAMAYSAVSTRQPPTTTTTSTTTEPINQDE